MTKVIFRELKHLQRQAREDDDLFGMVLVLVIVAMMFVVVLAALALAALWLMVVLNA